MTPADLRRKKGKQVVLASGVHSYDAAEKIAAAWRKLYPDCLIRRTRSGRRDGKHIVRGYQ